MILIQDIRSIRYISWHAAQTKSEFPLLLLLFVFSTLIHRHTYSLSQEITISVISRGYCWLTTNFYTPAAACNTQKAEKLKLQYTQPVSK